MMRNEKPGCAELTAPGWFPISTSSGFLWFETGHNRSTYTMEISKLYRSVPPPNQNQSLNVY